MKAGEANPHMSESWGQRQIQPETSVINEVPSVKRKG